MLKLEKTHVVQRFELTASAENFRAKGTVEFFDGDPLKSGAKRCGCPCDISLPEHLALLLEYLLSRPTVPHRISFSHFGVKVGDVRYPDGKVGKDLYWCLFGQLRNLGAKESNLTPCVFGCLEEEQLKAAWPPSNDGMGWSEAPSWVKRAFRIVHDYRVTGFIHDSSSLLLELTGSYQIHRYPLGEYACALPVPSPDLDKRVLPEHAIVVAHMHTPFPHQNELWKRLKALERAMANPGTTVLFGPPGSGKEVYATAIHHGSTRAQGWLRCVSVPGIGNDDEFKKYLFGTATPAGEVDGLIARSEGGTIMLDEIDKVLPADATPSKHFAAMLRVLEAKEYLPINSTATRKAEDITWIFAGAGLRETDERIPRDFWSRVTHQIELRNDLLIMDDERKTPLLWPFHKNRPVTLDLEYATALLLYFYARCVVKWTSEANWDWVEGDTDVRWSCARFHLTGTRDPVHDKKTLEAATELLDDMKDSLKMLWRRHGANLGPRDIRQAAEELWLGRRLKTLISSP